MVAAELVAAELLMGVDHRPNQLSTSNYYGHNTP